MISLSHYGVNVSAEIPEGADIYDVVPILRGMLVCLGYHMATVDSVFECKELEATDE